MHTNQIDVSTNNPTSIAIVGLGPRGAVILERIITWLEYACILLFDADSLGGSLVYNIESDNILLNTMCSQITLYSGETTKDFGPKFDGPSLYEYYK